MIVNASVRYAGSEGETGSIGIKENRQPDVVIDQMVLASTRLLPGLVASLPQPGLDRAPDFADPRIGIEDAQVMAANAMTQHSLAWGAHLSSILQSDDRFIGEEVPVGTFPRVMRARSAGQAEPGREALPDSLRSDRFNTDVNPDPFA
ncbi:MAG: hypothetical protein AAF556_10925, partial [Pseudomonadota bacterium]